MTAIDDLVVDAVELAGGDPLGGAINLSTAMENRLRQAIGVAVDAMPHRGQTRAIALMEAASAARELSELADRVRMLIEAKIRTECADHGGIA